jgi:hypothetical protein
MPILEETLLNLSAIDGDYPTAREVLLATRTFPATVTAHGRASLPYTTQCMVLITSVHLLVYGFYTEPEAAIRV